MKTSEGWPEGPLLPLYGDIQPVLRKHIENQNAGRFPNKELFVGGDVRANENPELAGLHALFVRYSTCVPCQHCLHSSNNGLFVSQRA